MNNAVDAKIHSFLVQSLEARRRQVIAQQAEAALRFEVIDERIEEREYDEKERLRVDRVINRRVIRGDAYERYSTVVSGLRGQGVGEMALASRLQEHLDSDLRDIAAPENVRNDPGGSMRCYSDLVPAEKWPAVLCMSQDPGAMEKLKSRLVSQGFALLPAELLEQFGIVKLTCPPEMSFVREIAGLPEAGIVADPLTPVTAPAPMAVTTMMVESREILGVTPDIMAQFGQDVTLAVLDTGVDRSHPALSRISHEDYQDFTLSGEEDVDGHGTHVASIAAGDDTTLGGRYSGIAPRCRLIAGKVLSPGRAGNLESILRGMAWAVVEKKADILSLSLGEMDTTPNGQSIWSKACAEAFRKGTVVCVAAGNPMPSYPESICVPADCPTAVTVGAIDKNRLLAAFSAQGSANPESPLFGKPNCVGPGVDVVAARSSTAGYDASEVVDKSHVRLSGTSMATPAIAGCLVLLKSILRSLGWEPTPADLVDLFYFACRPLKGPDGQEYASDMQVGHGLVNMTEAGREAQRRAPAHIHSSRAAAPAPAEVRSVPAVDEPEVVPARAAPAAPVGFEPDVCYRCGKRYLTKVGVFSPVWECRECGAPICRICWQLGHRSCERHKENASTPEMSPAPAPRASGAAAARDPVFLPSQAAASTRPGLTAEGFPRMTTHDLRSQPPPMAPVPCWGDTFINRFDLKVRDAGRVIHPWSGEEFEIDPKSQGQSFRRSFGGVTQFALAAGLLKKNRFILAAVRRDLEALAPGGAGLQGADSILQEIMGPGGLAFTDQDFYCVGIFSPTGWPEDWKRHAEARGNALFYLVEKGEGTSWIVFGHESPLRDLFDPETCGEKRVRAEKALSDHPRLALPGESVTMASFLAEHNLDRQSAAAAVQVAGGRFQILDHKGKTYIQRSIR